MNLAGVVKGLGSHDGYASNTRLSVLPATRGKQSGKQGLRKHDGTSKRNIGIYWMDPSMLRECKCDLHIRNRMARKTMEIFTQFEVRDPVNNAYRLLHLARAEVDAESAGIMVKLL